MSAMSWVVSVVLVLALVLAVMVVVQVLLQRGIDVVGTIAQPFYRAPSSSGAVAADIGAGGVAGISDDLTAASA